MTDIHGAIDWSEVRKPDEDCPYTHIFGRTVFGRILITWKGWKENDWPTVDESPWGWMQGGNNPDDTKRLVHDEFDRLLRAAICPTVTSSPSLETK